MLLVLLVLAQKPAETGIVLRQSLTDSNSILHAWPPWVRQGTCVNGGRLPGRPRTGRCRRTRKSEVGGREGGALFLGRCTMRSVLQGTTIPPAVPPPQRPAFQQQRVLALQLVVVLAAADLDESVLEIEARRGPVGGTNLELGRPAAQFPRLGQQGEQQALAEPAASMVVTDGDVVDLELGPQEPDTGIAEDETPSDRGPSWPPPG